MFVRPLRGALGAGLVAIFLTVGLAPSHAATDPAGFLESYSQRAIDTLSDASKSADSRREAFRRLLQEGFALPEIGRFVLGKHARAASEAEFDRFLDAFTSILARRYTPLFEGASEEQVSIGEPKPAEGRQNIYMVPSTVILNDGSKSNVVWRVKDTESGYQIMDVVAEGVSMAITLRDEYGEVLGSRGIDALTERLNEIAARPLEQS
jgi:phospholipid transport system substrate-binding protein